MKMVNGKANIIHGCMHMKMHLMVNVLSRPKSLTQQNHRKKEECFFGFIALIKQKLTPSGLLFGIFGGRQDILAGCVTLCFKFYCYSYCNVNVNEAYSPVI